MSLITQLWLAIILVTVVAFGGSVVIGSLSARAYLEEQLLLKNLDNANTLASSLSQVPKDPVTIDLLVSAQFDTGHYQLISLVDPQGQVIVERESVAPAGSAPAWFVRLLPIDVAPGVAQVQDGWNQFGTLTLRSHASFAYRTLWDGTRRLLGWFLAAALGVGLVGTLLLRSILRPLQRVVRQAEAIGARRFVTTEEPRTAEFRSVVRSMNALAGHVQHMLEEESRRLDQLRRASHHDAATGLLNREHFLARARSVLAREDADAHGILLVARLIELQALNRAHGWSLMDTQIRRFAEALATIPKAGGDWVAGRLSGSDFALFAPGPEAADELGRLVHEGFRSVAVEVGLGDAPRLAVAVTAYRHGEALAVVLERADAALAAAVAQGGSIVADGNAAATSAASRQGELVTWRARFDTALEQGQVKLQSFPVVDAEGSLMHDECFARLRLGGSEDWQPAREFVPWLSRRGDLPRLDELVVDLAIEGLRDGTGRLCINLAAESLGEGSVRRIAAKLAAEPELAGRLAIEVPEHGVFQHFDGFRLLCTLLVPLGCKVGIEHMGHEVSRIGALRDLGIDYVKVDASFTQGIETSSANQTFLRGLAMIVHAIGLRAIAEGVESESAFRTLMELGFDGATGPAITARGR